MSSSIGFALVGLVAPAFSKIAYNPHSPVAIDSRADLIANAGSEGWPGTGSEPDPYVVISDCDMDATGVDSAIHIAHTSLYSVIEGCVLHGANAADIYLSDVMNGGVLNNTCSGSSAGSGTYISGSRNCEAVNNSCSNNDSGIELSTSTELFVESNTLPSTQQAWSSAS